MKPWLNHGFFLLLDGGLALELNLNILQALEISLNYKQKHGYSNFV
jgi:hypothetical protein